ncbi:DUF4190 domain-containing protein [Burkholderia sp. RS01]|uniref:DUF4190 domain-containing protein n=1 Tax=unclassified Burkholderia TaxID=2613784 RepID=UPI0032186CC7
MTEQRPAGTGGDQTPDGYQPPSSIPPQGSDIPAPPLYTPPGEQYGQPYGQQYGEPGGQNDRAGEGYGSPYSQPRSPYAQPGGPYGQPGQYGSPYGQPGQYGSPYGQPSYYGMAPAPKNLSIASLCCGIAVYVGFGVFLLPQLAAVILGHMALRREPSGRGFAIAGLVMGYIGIALTVLAIVALAVLASLATTSSSTF